MAVIQDIWPRGFRRSPGPGGFRGAPTFRSAPARTRVSIGSWKNTIFVAVAVTGAAVLYLSGYQRMVGINYQHVTIGRQIRDMETRRHILRGRIDGLKNEAGISAWAASHGMEQPTGAPVIVRRAEGGL